MENINCLICGSAVNSLYKRVVNRFDKTEIKNWEIIVRIFLAALVISSSKLMFSVGISLSILLLIWHHFFNKGKTLSNTI